MGGTLHILQDRTELSQLAHDHPELAATLNNSRLGIKTGRSALQYCGLASVADDHSYVFIPRKSRTGVRSEDLETARLTMRALARFGRDMIGRMGVATGGEDNAGLLALVVELAKDFIEYGIYSDRATYAFRNSGKPNWPRTVIREPAFLSNDGSVVYPSIRTTRSRDSHDSLLTQVQVAVLLEVSRLHGWWIDGLSGREDELKCYDTPNIPRILWAKRLRLLLPELYATRAIRLANKLISYLVKDPGSQDGEVYYGVEDFHSVWEHMLRQVLSGVEAGWNSRLPRPAYLRSVGGYAIQDRGLQTDMVLRDESGNLHVVDAKYYDATLPNNTPGLADIIKQFFYDMAISSISRGEAVRGCFVFPASRNEVNAFNSVLMLHRDGSKASNFPEINCYYLEIVSIMRAFCEGRKIRLPTKMTDPSPRQPRRLKPQKAN